MHTTQIRQKVQQARELAKQGKPEQAKALLKGIQHPKVAALVVQLDEQIAVQRYPAGSVRFSLLPILGLVSIILVLMAGIFLLSFSQQRMVETHTILPTLIPTMDCSKETVQTWWQVQDMELASFSADASSASRTMPGNELSRQIDKLHQFRDSFPPLPVCASAEVRTAVSAMIVAMDQTITVAEHWNNGQVDGTQATNEFDNAETMLRQAKAQLRKVLIN